MKHVLIRKRIYIDTSVIGGCYDKEFDEWSNQLVVEFIRGIKIAVVSDVMLEELEDAPENVQKRYREIPSENKESIILDDEARALANVYLKEKIVTINSLQDTRHIALATVNKVDVLVSWNFKHIVNYNKIRLYNSVNLKLGYPMIEIRTPREILDEA
ncbi:MAG: hypothetical protein KGZ58_09645 [Ignavibacteriales bacterium]|nr:hypothetical protein [Ignavibacteriales bacterium]